MRRLVLLALFATACGSTAVSGPALALVFHTGDVYRYSFESTGHVAIEPSPPDPVRKSAHLTYTVTSVDSSGTADLSLEASGAVVTSTEGPVTPPAGTSLNGTTKLQVTSGGRILSQTVSGTAFGGGTWWAVLPGRAVKPGDSWTDDFDVTYPGFSITGHFKTKSRYLRDESFQGSNAAVIESTFTTTAGAPNAPLPPPTPSSSGDSQSSTVQETSTATATTWIDRAAGRVLKSHVVTKYLASFIDTSGLLAPTRVSGDETADLLPG